MVMDGRSVPPAIYVLLRVPCAAPAGFPDTGYQEYGVIHVMNRCRDAGALVVGAELSICEKIAYVWREEPDAPPACRSRQPHSIERRARRIS
jgi:hypothetical protein